MRDVIMRIVKHGSGGTVPQGDNTSRNGHKLLQGEKHFRKPFKIHLAGVPATGNPNRPAGIRASAHGLQHMAFMNLAR